MKFINPKSSHLKFNVKRSKPRRQDIARLPPYITEEGLVLIDRRSNGDRRLPSIN